MAKGFFGISGGSGGVSSVTGEGVNNSDANNPVITKTPTHASIFVSNNNEDVTSVTGDPSLFVIAKVSNLSIPDGGYDGGFDASSSGDFSVNHTDDESDYKMEISGTVTSLNPDFLNTFIVIKVDSDLQGEFTGGVKAYPVGVTFGVSAEIGFGIKVYGKLQKNESINLSLSSSAESDLILNDCIFFAEKIQPST